MAKPSSKHRMRFPPGDFDAAAPVIAALLDEYETWWRSANPDAEVVDSSDFGLLLDWKVGYGNGRLDGWSATEVEEFLLAWCPRKLSVSGDAATQIPSNVATAFTFLGEAGYLTGGSARGIQLAAHARGLQERFIAEMSDPDNFGMAKSIFGSAGVDLDEPLSGDQLDAIMADFNNLPFEQRAAITDRALGSQPLPVLGPVVLPSAQAVRELAAAAPVLTGFAELAQYFGSGRKLTAKGNIRLADAEALAPILGTETTTEMVGDLSFARRSAANMPKLDHWQWWARECGALRVHRGGLVAVAAWQRRREKDPVAEARRAFEVLMRYGPVGSYLTGPRGFAEAVDAMAGPLLALMLTAPDQVEFADLVDAVVESRESSGREPLLGDAAYERAHIAGLVDVLLTLWERAGVLVQHAVTFEPARYGERRAGGTAGLTPFGTVMAVEHLRAEGLQVLTIEDPGSLSAREVADVVVDTPAGPDAWLQLVTAWLSHQGDRRAALRALLVELAGNGGLIAWSVLTGHARSESVEDVDAVMAQLWLEQGPDAALGAVAGSWLIERGWLTSGRLTPEDAANVAVAMLGLVARDDPEAVPAAMGADASREGLLEFVATAGRRMPENIDALLDAMGKHHPDAVVAKAARKELFRVRGRMAQRERMAQPPEQVLRPTRSNVPADPDSAR